MTVTPGLRERKKLRTRERILREAFSLIERQGYAATTADEIARRAEVSTRTFYRYFPTKEAVLHSDDLTDLVISAFYCAPIGLGVADACRHALAEAFGTMSVEECEHTRQRLTLLHTLPEAGGALYLEWSRATRLLTSALAKRMDLAEDDAMVWVTAGAVTGVLQAALMSGPPSQEKLMTALTALRTQAIF
jgi:AcrR family transcriptional regulator